ncbi:helix-turn-helix domain-containing protein [Patescibacteria group bacterium]|nr:MAG: helix-turn-helix domain-containing protein [Patescibacteria group bacterium]
MNEEEKEFLSIREAAEYLGVSVNTLRRWDESGKLKPVRNPANDYRMYRRSDLEPYKVSYRIAETTDEVITNYFITTPASIEANNKLREPQREAHHHVREHFENTSTPAILQIPVGCGKTGVIASLPYGIARGRILVIAPNVTIRNGIFDALDTSSVKNFLRKTDVISDPSKLPFAAILDGKDANVHDCVASHFVITNIQQLASSADRWLPKFPPNFFDMILIDEGHHNVAPSWRKIFDRFPQAKVVSLTATPFRGDGQPLNGSIVYQYPFTKAMLKGYIKTITALNAAPSELTFTYRGEMHAHTLEEVLALREEQWFRKGVALSPECNRAIVEKSIQKLSEMRTQTGHNHQIIAVACSVDHAKQVRSLYEERGLKAREIYSEMNPEEKDQVIALLRQGTLDCIVQVQMLGEGFDHPSLSIAAVFRPYLSLSPYIQFIGRIMRVVAEGQPENPDNHGYVISHVGLNNEQHWNDFKEFDLDDQATILKWIHADGDNATDGESESSGTGRPRRFDGGMQGANEVISHFMRESFLDPEDDRVVARLLATEIPGTGLTIQDLGITLEALREILRKKYHSEQGSEAPTPSLAVTPQRGRQAARTRLSERLNAVGIRVLSDLNLGRKGREIGRHVLKNPRMENVKAIAKLLNEEANACVGKDTATRPDWSEPELRKAMECLDAIGDELRDKIRSQIPIKD